MAMKRMAFVLLALVAMSACHAKDNDMRHQQSAATSSTLAIPYNGTVTVPTDGTSVSSASLTRGVAYKVTVTGTFTIGGAGDQLGDAEYANFSDPPTSLADKCPDGVDFGLAIDDQKVDAQRSPRWGGYQPDHTYSITYYGGGRPAVFSYQDCDPAGNVGTLAVVISA